MQHTQSIQQLLQQLDLDCLIKIVLHTPKKSSQYKKVIARVVTIKNQQWVQFEKFTATQAFHKNITINELYFEFTSMLQDFDRATIITTINDYEIFNKDKTKIVTHKNNKNKSTNINDHPIQPSTDNILATNETVPTTKQSTKQMPITSHPHNKTKNYLLPKDSIIPPLIDLGIITIDGKIVSSKYDKYKQINRFLELVNDITKDFDKNNPIYIVDFGCGKGYLTFILYHFLHDICHYSIQMVGVDQNQSIVDKCTRTAQKYGYHNLQFEASTIQNYQPKCKVDIVISLHACDTATDYTLQKAIEWNAKAILCVPCCQHEISQQLTKPDKLINKKQALTVDNPTTQTANPTNNEHFNTNNFSLCLLTKYGIIKDRFATLLTDTIRANILQAYGYSVQLLEFIDLEHSPKNILIRAIKQQSPNEETKQNAKFQVLELQQQLGINSKLAQLLL